MPVGTSVQVRPVVIPRSHPVSLPSICFLSIFAVLSTGKIKKKKKKENCVGDHRNVSHSFVFRSDAIYSAMYDGSGLIEVLRGHEYLSHPFAVTMYGGEVYWTDWRTNTLAKANKWTGNNVTVVQRTNTQPFDLQVYHPSRQPQGKTYLIPFLCKNVFRPGEGLLLLELT